MADTIRNPISIDRRQSENVIMKGKKSYHKAELSVKSKNERIEIIEDEEFAYDDVDENVTIYGIAQYLQKDNGTHGRPVLFSSQPRTSSSLTHMSIISDSPLTQKGFILFGNRFVASSFKKNFEGVLSNDVEQCSTQEDLIDKVTKAACDHRYCLLLIEVPQFLEAIKRLRQIDYMLFKRPYAIAVYSQEGELLQNTYKEAGFDECIPKSSGREILQNLMNKI